MKKIFSCASGVLIKENEKLISQILTFDAFTLFHSFGLYSFSHSFNIFLSLHFIKMTSLTLCHLHLIIYIHCSTKF